MSKDKIYLNPYDQLKHLKIKGLGIPSDKLAENYLRDIGYYKLINGYKRPFMYKKENGETAFLSGTTINDLYNLYKFDQSLKSLIFKNILLFEVMVKNRMTDLITRKYGLKETQYLNPKNFKPDSKNQKGKTIKDFCQEILQNIYSQNGKHKAITHYATHYGYYPFWVTSNIITLGTTSLLYTKMIQSDQNEISKTFGLKSKTFESILMILQLFRNACAHDEVIYNYKTFCSLSQKDLINLFDELKIPKNITTGRYMYGINDILAVVICLELVLNKVDFNEFITQLKPLLNKLKSQINDSMYKNVIEQMGIRDYINKIFSKHKIK